MQVIDRLRLTIREAAEALGVTRQALSTLINGRSSLTAEMAIRLDKAFGLAMEELMRLQLAYDIERARTRENEIRVAKYVPHGPPPVQPNLL